MMFMVMATLRKTVIMNRKVSRASSACESTTSGQHLAEAPLEEEKPDDLSEAGLGCQLLW